MARLDPHSYNDDTQAETESLAWTARVDFATRTLVAEAVLTFRAARAVATTETLSHGLQGPGGARLSR